MHDGLVPRVNVVAEVWGAATGALLQTITCHNLVTLAGRNLVRDLLNWFSAGDGTQPKGLGYFAAGTGTTTPAAADTDLGAEVFRDVWTQKTATDGQLLLKYYLASGSANSNTLAEVGAFGNAATGTANSGTLYAHALLSSTIAKTSAIAVTFTWTLTWADDGV